MEPLLQGLADEYSERYIGSDEISRGEVEDFDPPGGLFVVVVDGERTVAGGGYRHLKPRVCEVKRMWTDPSYRRRGLASMVLDELEAASRAVGYEFLRLETGPRQPEAEAMYARRYRRIETYGPYPLDSAFEHEL